MFLFFIHKLIKNMHTRTRLYIIYPYPDTYRLRHTMYTLHSIIGSLISSCYHQHPSTLYPSTQPHTKHYSIPWRKISAWQKQDVLLLEHYRKTQTVWQLKSFIWLTAIYKIHLHRSLLYLYTIHTNTHTRTLTHTHIIIIYVCMLCT